MLNKQAHWNNYWKYFFVLVSNEELIMADRTRT